MRNNFEEFVNPLVKEMVRITFEFLHEKIK